MKFDMAMVAGGIFGFAGLVMLGGGIVIALDEPAGLVLSVFGLVFMGAGYAAWRMMRVPPGKRAVTVHGETSRTAHGSRQTSVILYVDEDASEADVEAARQNWLHETIRQQAGPRDGVIVEFGVSNQSLHRAAAIAWSVFAAGMVAAAFIWGGMMIFFAVPVVGVTGVLVWQYVAHRRRQARFGTSRFRMDPCPTRLGGRVLGIVETGIAQDLQPADGFELTLRCIHRYETSERRGDETRKVYKRDTLWESSSREAGSTAMRAGFKLDVPVAFEVPPDQPATSLGGDSEGHVWELAVRAALPGLDYAAEFRLPVLDDATADEFAAMDLRAG